MENDWAKAIKEGKTVEVEIRPVYKGDLKRPYGFNVEYKIGKNTFKESFKN